MAMVLESIDSMFGIGNKPIVVGLVGHAGSGKTSIARYLVSCLGFIRLSFADPIKRMLSVLVDDCDDRVMREFPNDKLCGKSIRYGLQTLGTEWGRNLIGDDIWVAYMNRCITGYIKMGCMKFVIDDVRFLNEASLVESFNDDGYGIVIRIVRDHTDCKEMDHQSESELNKINAKWVVYNNSALESACLSVKSIILFEAFGELQQLS